MVFDASARIFGGSVVPQEIKGALRREAEDQVQELAGGRQLAPNLFTVMLSPHDLDRIAGDDGSSTTSRPPSPRISPTRGWTPSVRS
jgi:hypothetical protein